MILKLISTIAILALGFEVNFAQELRPDHSFADSINKVDRVLGRDFYAIILYNEAVKSFGYPDTIKIIKSDNQYNFFYKDSLITDLRNWYLNEQRLVIFHYAHTANYTFLNSTTQQSLTNNFEIIIREASFDRNDLVYKLSNYLHDIQTGRYEERTKSGKVLLTGQYCQIDSMYVDTLQSVDVETYEDIVEIIPRTKFAIKSGKWYYYSTEGVLIKEEEHKTCK